MASKHRPTPRARRKKLIGVCVVLAVIFVVVLAITGAYAAYEKETVSRVYPELTLEAGSPVITEADLLAKPDGKPVTILENVTEAQMRVPGNYTVLFTWRDRTFSTVLHVVDTVAPEGTAQDLTAVGPLPPASDFLTSINDTTDVTVSYKEEPDMTKAGTREITLVLTDAAGNTTELPAKITVVVDTQAPVISGAKNITVYVGGTVAYRADVTVTDDLDAAPTLDVDNTGVDLHKVGKYTATYVAKDASGNETKKQITVDVREKTAHAVDLDTVNQLADQLIGQIIKPNTTQKQQVRAIYNWARSACSYSNHSDKSDYLQGAYQMLTKKSGDCFNYYAVTKLLFDRLGIPNQDVRKVKNNPTDSDHYWSLVSLDEGKTWYHFDSTPRVGDGDNFCLVTDAFLDAYSDSHRKCHNRDKSLYPATPEN